MNQHTKILIAIVSVVVILVILFLFFANLKNTNPSNIPNSANRNTNATNTTRTQNLPTSPTIPVPTVSMQNWQLGNNDQYTISFPQTWTPTTLAVIGGGTAVGIQPSASSTDTFPRVDITTSASASDGAVQIEMNNLKSTFPQSYAQSTTSFKGIPVIEIKITINSEENLPTLNKTFLFFSHNGYKYMVDYAVIPGSNAPTDTTLVLQILNSIQFK